MLGEVGFGQQVAPLGCSNRRFKMAAPQLGFAALQRWQQGMQYP